MKIVLIVYNEAVDMEVMETLGNCALKNYTKVLGVFGKGEGMMTMNQSLYRLYRRGLITKDMAFKRSPNPEGLLNLIERGGVNG